MTKDEARAVLQADGASDVWFGHQPVMGGGAMGVAINALVGGKRLRHAVRVQASSEDEAFEAGLPVLVQRVQEELRA